MLPAPRDNNWGNKCVHMDKTLRGLCKKELLPCEVMGFE